MELEISEWVDSSSEDRKTFSQAVHVILQAIASSDDLKQNMVMKGGMLLGIRYKSSRYTEDIDFSTEQSHIEWDKDEFTEELNASLLEASDELSYGIECRLQSTKFQPKSKPGPEISFPSLTLKIGYAKKGTKDYKRLQNNNCTNIIKIDYSFNEYTCKPEDIELSSEDGILAYSLTDLIAEKIRSVIQQLVRDRERRQDIYDLHHLICTVDDISEEEKLDILKALKLKSKGRVDDEWITKTTFEREDLREISSRNFHLIAVEVEGDLPSFDDAYDIVSEFYANLPWDYE